MPCPSPHKDIQLLIKTKSFLRSLTFSTEYSSKSSEIQSLFSRDAEFWSWFLFRPNNGIKNSLLKAPFLFVTFPPLMPCPSQHLINHPVMPCSSRHLIKLPQSLSNPQFTTHNSRFTFHYLHYSLFTTFTLHNETTTSKLQTNLPRRIPSRPTPQNPLRNRRLCIP